MTLATRLRTYAALGPRSLARVAVYRLGLRSGRHPVQRIVPPARITGPFFRAKPVERDLPPASATTLQRFDIHEVSAQDGPPDWFANPFGRDLHAAADKSWWTIGDFGQGDIKGVWEMSRLGWMFPLAQAAAHGDAGAATRLNQWLQDWVDRNRAYLGPNWKCGQEASIRVLHLCAAALLLQETAEPCDGLLDLVEAHLARISPTVGYALGQDNNHGTSEAAALFVGGMLLEAAGRVSGKGPSALGRSMLQERAEALIGPDGSFSQHSVNYHRVMLDAYWFAELWRREHGAAPFTAATIERLQAATRWLHAMVDPESGDAPNIGASDGARLFPITSGRYRDFRPSVQMAAALFLDARAYVSEDASVSARWFGLSLPDEKLAPASSRSFDDGGWHVLHKADALAVMRYPRFRFRPGHADALHVDLLAKGRNLLRDAGTYSYNDPDRPDGDFAATRFHNTVEFDGRDQMPRLSRFLFGDWLKSASVEKVADDGTVATCAASYVDREGCRHSRRLRMTSGMLVCEDEVEGDFGEAVLRWRLPFADWAIDGSTISGDGLEIELEATGSPLSLSLMEGVEARHYLDTQAVSVIEGRVTKPCRIRTEFRY